LQGNSGSASRTGTGLAADSVIGHIEFQGNAGNQSKAVLPNTLCWPYGIALHRRTLVIAYTDNNRVTI
jgi:hypothetical protein